MDIEGIAVRVLRSLGYGLAAAIGLFLAGAGNNAILAIGALIAVLQVLNVLTYWASTSAALLLVWGALVAAGLVPGALGLGPLGDRIAQMAHDARDKALVTPTPGAAPAPAEAAAAPADAAAGTLEDKLTQLKAACDKKLMGDDECAKAKADIMAKFAK